MGSCNRRALLLPLLLLLLLRLSLHSGMAAWGSVCLHERP
jgi:hypothetical protein